MNRGCTDRVPAPHSGSPSHAEDRGRECLTVGHRFNPRPSSPPSTFVLPKILGVDAGRRKLRSGSISVGG